MGEKPLEGLAPTGAAKKSSRSQHHDGGSSCRAPREEKDRPARGSPKECSKKSTALIKVRTIMTEARRATFKIHSIRAVSGPVNTMNRNWRSYPWLQISILLYLIACCCPALELQTMTGQPLTTVGRVSMYGFQILLKGFLGIFWGIIAWFANPLWVLALLLVFFKRVKAALVVSLVSLAIAFTSFLAIGKDLATWKSDVYHQVIGDLLPGCFLWMASLAGVPLACWLKMTNKSGEGYKCRSSRDDVVTL